MSGGRREGVTRMLNPLRSEEEAFRFLLYAVVVVFAIVGLVLLGRALL